MKTRYDRCAALRRQIPLRMTTSMIDRSHVSSRADAVAKQFREVYGASPRGIFRAPGRVNLIGEHTDYNDGFVMPAAIDFYSYAAIGERADRMLSVYSEQFRETVRIHSRSAARYLHANTGATTSAESRRSCEMKDIRSRVPTSSSMDKCRLVRVSVRRRRLRLRLPCVDVAWRSHNSIARSSQAVSARGKHLHRRALRHHGPICFVLRQAGPRADARLQVAGGHVPATASHCSLGDLQHDGEARTRRGEYNERRASCERVVKTIAKFLPNVRALRDLNTGGSRTSPKPDFRRRLSALPARDHRERPRQRCDRGTESVGNLVRFGELMYLSHDSLDRDYEVSCKELNIMVDVASRLNGCSARE